MRLVVMTLLCAAVISICSICAASEEEFVEWSQVKIVSPSYAETGKIIFTARIDDSTYKSVSIFCFGKRFDMRPADLARLQGFPVSSLRITHEAGYPKLGGHTVHFRLTRVVDLSGKPVEKRMLISISKGKGLEVHEPEAR